MPGRTLRRAIRVSAALWVALGLAPSVVGLIHHPTPTMSVLQMNLCNSGWAGCYTGRSVREAAAVIRAERPDVVTLNEICRDDLVALAGPDAVASFQPVLDRRIGLPIRCRDGEPYGIGLLVHGSRAPSRGGIYPYQSPGSPEGRAWLCAPAAGFTACTTHLVNANPLIALAQCRYLFAVVVPAIAGPVVVGGDFNLADLSTCRATGHEAGSDGGLQHVVVSGPATPGTPRSIDMRKATDHPALLVVRDR